MCVSDLKLFCCIMKMRYNHHSFITCDKLLYKIVVQHNDDNCDEIDGIVWFYQLLF